MITVKSVDALPEARLRIKLSTGRWIEVDIADYLDAPGYERLANTTFFRKVGIAEWGHGVSWPGDIAIPIDTLNRLAKEQLGLAWPTHFFNAWMERNGMCDTDAAKVLGLTRKTILRYQTGASPIPKYIGLACEGWEIRLANKKLAITKRIQQKYRGALQQLAK